MKKYNISTTEEERKAHDLESGTISMLSWDCPNLWIAIEKLFNTQSREKLVGIVVDEYGITARFNYKKKD